MLFFVRVALVIMCVHSSKTLRHLPKKERIEKRKGKIEIPESKLPILFSNLSIIIIICSHPLSDNMSITHKMTKTIHPNLRDWDYGLPVIASC